MKTQNSILIATVAALAFALAPVTEAVTPPLPLIGISHGWGNSFELIESGVPFFGVYVNFKVSGTAIPGVDYHALVSPAYVPRSGYGAIPVQTLPDPRASSNNEMYSVVVTLEPGPGYVVGQPSSAVIWIMPRV